MYNIGQEQQPNANIGNKQQSNETNESDKSIRHYPSISDGDVIEIKLNFRNSSLCTFPNRQKGIVLWDSGATFSLISEGTIRDNNYLKNIKPVSTPNTKFMVGNGNFILSTQSITFNMVINGNMFQLTAYIVPTLGGISVIVGTKSLKELEAELHFKHNILKFRTKEIRAKIARNAILKPGATKILSMKTKMPDILKSAEVYFQAGKFLSKFVPSLMLVKMNKGITRIAVHNSSNKTIKIRCDKPIGTFLLKNFGSVPSNQTMTFSEMTDESSNLSYSMSNVGSKIDKPDRRQIYLDKKQRYPFLDKDDARLTMTDEEVLRKDIDLTQHCMSTDTYGKFWKLLDERKKAFSIHGEVGECPDLSIKIKLNDESPFFVRPYPVSEKEKEVIDKEMAKLVKMGILTYGKSSYVSPILLLKKKNNPDNPYRLVSDFRKLNSKIVPLHYCTPLLRDALQIIGNSDAKIFSTIDIKNAFYSLRVHPESQKFLTIAPYQSARTLKYLRLPQGLSISPTEWNDKIADILSEIPKHTKFSLGIADDVIIFSKNEKEHLKHIEVLLHLFEKHGLKLSVNKCQFFRKSLNYMGHIINITEGRPSITPQKSKVEAIDQLQPPKTPKQTKSLIGMVAYLSMYIPKLQILLAPLHKLTRKGAKFEWTKEMADNFSEIKEILKTSPVLTLPAKEGLLRLYCDTSFIGTGACLCQVQNGKERILAYYSKKLPESARRFTCSELEGAGMQACVHAFRHLLRSAPFEIITDHSALINISKSKTEPPTLRLKKIFERLSAYKFTLRYKKGKEMVISDYFSRHPSGDVDDNDPIAFLNEHEKQSDNVAHKEQQGSDSDATLYVTTRSSARRSGEELLTGLPTFTRGRCADHPEEVSSVNPLALPNPQFSRRGRPRTRSCPARPHVNETTDVHSTPNTDYSPLPYFRRESSLSPLRPKTTILQQIHSQKTEEHPTKELPTRLTDMANHRTRELSFREKLTEPTKTFSETHTHPEGYMYNRPTRIFGMDEDIDIFHKNIPKQNDLERMLKTLSKKLITDSHLQISKAELAKHQAADPYFKPILNWLKHDHLPERARAQKKIKLISEDFALVGDILFKMNINENNTINPLTFSLCIPEVLEPMIFHMEHESLYSNHMGITKTYLTMRKRFYIKNLFSKLTHYIRSCHQCQTQKAPTDVERPYNARIPAAYRPFQRLVCDIKYMPMSSSGNSYLLVITCEITRYTYAIPLKRADSQTIAEVLLRRIVLMHGEPESIITDEDRAFNNQVCDFLWKAIRTKPITCSPYNHGSLQVERHIQSISNLISSNLRDTGKNWDSFCESATFAYNTHIIPRIGHSPYYLVYMREPPTLTELKFTPLTDIKCSYRQYVQFLQERLEHVGKSVLDTQAKLQSLQAAKHMEKVRQPNKYREGLIVYLNAPSASSLKTNTLKFKADYVGPVYIFELLGNDKTILSSLDGRILHGVFHVNRLKPGFIRLEHGSASHIDEVRRAYTQKQIQNMSNSTTTDIQAAGHSTGHTPQGEAHTAAACTVQTALAVPEHIPEHSIILDTMPVDHMTEAMYMGCLSDDNKLGTKNMQSKKQQAKQKALKQKHATHITQQGENMNISKIRCKNGHIQLCLQGEIAGPAFSFWYEPRLHPNNCKVIGDYLKKNCLKIHGSLGRMASTLFLC